jgi:DNA-binding beta-propeller fold protein YncE
MRGSMALKTIAVVGLALASTASGCSCDDSSPTSGPGSGGSGASSGTGGNGGAGPQGSGNIKTATEAANDPSLFSQPFDAALSADGTVVYFTALDANGEGAVFSVPASGSSAPTSVARGFVAPFGIAVSSDGRKLYVADVGAATSATVDAGKIFAVGAESGDKEELGAGESAIARSLEVLGEGSDEQIYFAGTVGGNSGVFRIAGNGSGGVETVASGEDFRDPAGVAVARDGTVYVLDTVGGTYANDASTILVIDTDNKVSTLLNNIRVNYPAGIALSEDESALLVSSVLERGANPVPHAVVQRVDIASREVTKFPKNDETNDTFVSLFEPGGMHRAKAADVYAWAIADARGGTVYVLK